jgi:hypothetical protein
MALKIDSHGQTRDMRRVFVYVHGKAIVFASEPHSANTKIVYPCFKPRFHTRKRLVFVCAAYVTQQLFFS